MGSRKIKTGRFRSKMGSPEESYVLRALKWKGLKWSHRKTQYKAEKKVLIRVSRNEYVYTEQRFIPEWFNNKSYIRRFRKWKYSTALHTYPRLYHGKSVYCSQNAYFYWERDGRVFKITCSHLGFKCIEWEGIRDKEGLHAVRLPLRGFYYTTHNWHLHSILKVKVSSPSQQSYGKTVNRLRNLLVAISLPRFPSQPTPPLNPTPPTPAPRTKRPHTHVNSKGVAVWRYHRKLLQHRQMCLCYSQLTTWLPDPQESISLVLKRR